MLPSGTFPLLFTSVKLKNGYAYQETMEDASFTSNFTLSSHATYPYVLTITQIVMSCYEFGKTPILMKLDRSCLFFGNIF